MARELRAVTVKIRELSNMAAGIYTIENRAAFSFVKAAEGLERLLREMQAQAALDCPEDHTEHLYV
jgi:hypothetical protein